jgi:hypothetical protein
MPKASVTCCWFPSPTKALASPFVSVTESCWLPPPTEVLVSPLQRTLQTADLVFPDHCNIRVRDELRERLTGRPADNRMATFLAEQKFSHFVRALEAEFLFSVKTSAAAACLPPAGRRRNGSMLYDYDEDDDFGDDDDGDDDMTKTDTKKNQHHR